MNVYCLRDNYFPASILELITICDKAPVDVCIPNHEHSFSWLIVSLYFRDGVLCFKDYVTIR